VLQIGKLKLKQSLVWHSITESDIFINFYFHKKWILAFCKLLETAKDC